MSNTRIDDRQVINHAALPNSIGSATNTTLDVLFSTIDSAMVNITGVQTISGAKTFGALGTALTVNNNARINGAIGIGGTSQNSGTDAWSIFIQNSFTATSTGRGVSIGNTYVGPTTTVLDIDSAPKFTTGNVITFANAKLEAPVLASGGTVTTSIGAWIPTHSNGTNNAAISDNSAFSGNWFINQSGSAASTFGGQITTAGDITLAGAAGNRTISIQSNTSGNPQLALIAAGVDSATLYYNRVSDYFGIDVGGTTDALKIDTSGNATLGKGSALNFQGSSSGIISILPQSASGTFNFNLPTTAGISGQVLTSGGGGASPMTWTSVLTNPMTTAGDIIYENATPAPARLPIGSTNQVLQVVSGLPSWQSFKVPTVQRFLGSGTYTTPAGVLYIKVRIVGGGGGGAGSGVGATGGNGGSGGTSSFGPNIQGIGGTGASLTQAGKGGGYSVTGAGVLDIGGSIGATGQGADLNGTGGAAGSYGTGGTGGNSSFGDAAYGTINSAPPFPAGHGSGGAGGGNNAVASSYAGGGGGSGGEAYVIITSPASSYVVTIGSGGTAGTAGTSGFAGSAGGSGLAFIEEYYQ